MTALPGKTVSHSRIQMIHRPQPDETNTSGVLHGGRLLFHLDTAAGMVAMRHAANRVVTACVERVDFRLPVLMGDDLVIMACVNMAHKTSIQVGLRVETINPCTGAMRHAATAYFTLVALDEEGHPTPVPPIIPETDEDRRRMHEAICRRKAWLERLNAC